jgi:hypothetical protein
MKLITAKSNFIVDDTLSLNSHLPSWHDNWQA